MESFCGETGESTEDVPGRKKSKLKSLRTRLFGRTKRGGGDGDAKLSHSAADITAGEELGSHEDLVCSQGVMGSRALSHDSIFLADQDSTDPEPARVLSQENVHSKIKALQIKLQQQKMHFGPPPLVLPVRRPEDQGEGRSEEDSVPYSPNKTVSQQPLRPLSPKPAPTKSLPLTPSLSLPVSVPSNPSPPAAEAPLDFSSPVQFTACLDTSAARHRMSVKPRNQRASTKKPPAANERKSDFLNNIDHHELVREEQRLSAHGDPTVDAEQGGTAIPITSQCLPSEVAPITPDTVQKSSQQAQAPLGRASSAALPSHVLRVKPPRPLGERPHSSFIQSDLKDNRDVELEKRNPLRKPGITEVSSIQVETGSGIKRPTTGSGSFHFSRTPARNWDAERPRSGSFVGSLEHTETRHKMEDRPFALGRLRPEGTPHKNSAPWDRRDSLKKVELVTTPKGVSPEVALESSQGVVEEAVEAQEVEEEGKTAFGVKLRSSSLSIRFRSDSLSNQDSKPLVSEEQCDKGHETRDPRPTDPVGSFLSAEKPQSTVTEGQTSSSNLKETAVEQQAGSQNASSELSWMSFAMEKTRSFQQLITSRFPRDFTSTRPETPTGEQTVKTQTPAEVGNQTSTQAQTIRPSLTAVQHKVSPLQASREGESQSSSRPPAAQASSWISQHASVQIETTSAQASATQTLAQFYLSSGQQQPPPSSRSLNQQLKSTTPGSAPGPDPGPGPGLGRGERGATTVQEKAAALVKRAEGTTPPGTKGISGESPALVKPSPLSKDIKPEGRFGVKLAASSPTKVPERPHEDKRLQRNVVSSSPSSSPKMTSMSMPESEQPSWMELAKRKSMAWSDKTMD